MSSIEFRAYPKTPRYFRDIIITEKIDGTNSAVIIRPLDEIDTNEYDHRNVIDILEASDDRTYVVAAQSRKRLITPGKQTDNYGFAGWVQSNAQQLVDSLGAGTHFGEWWGRGIQRGYGLTERRFSLFNPSVAFQSDPPEGVDTVPVLYRGPNHTNAVQESIDGLEWYGSQAAPGYGKPEGVVVYHGAGRHSYKALLEGDDHPKGERPE